MQISVLYTAIIGIFGLNQILFWFVWFCFVFWLKVKYDDLPGHNLSKHNEPTKAASSCNNNLSKNTLIEHNITTTATTTSQCVNEKKEKHIAP